MKKLILFILGVACVLSSCNAQPPSETTPGTPLSKITPLKIGDTVPDIVFHHMLNYRDSTVKLSDFQGKLVILDFWSSWCSVCIGLFPHMNELQQQFGDSLQIILVNGKSKLTGDDAPKIQKIMDRVNKVYGIDLQLPIVYDCPALDSLFIYNALPHEVWLDDHGKIIAITSAKELTSANINAVLARNNADMRLKMDITDFDSDIPLFVNGNAGDGNIFLYRSIITGCQKGTLNVKGYRRNNKGEVIGIYMFNQPLLSLLSKACTDCSFQQNLIVDETDHTIPLSPPNNESRYQYLYCYDLSIPPTTSWERISMYIKKDIERCFHVTIGKEKRKIKCLILKATPALKESFAKGGKMEAEFEAHAVNKYLRNHPISRVVQLLNSYLPVPLVDETSINRNIDMKLPYDLHDQQAVVQALKNAGFSVEKGEREMIVTVVSNTQ